jgi:hypothetical protein
MLIKVKYCVLNIPHSHREIESKKFDQKLMRLTKISHFFPLFTENANTSRKIRRPRDIFQNYLALLSNIRIDPSNSLYKIKYT